MAEQITSLVIYKRTNIMFEIVPNEVPANAVSSSHYSGTSFGDFIDIKTKTGANLFQKVPYTVIRYINEVDPLDMTFSSAFQAMSVLKQEGFFEIGSGSGSGGGATLFKELADVNVPTFAGRAGYGIRINNAATALEAYQFLAVTEFTDLADTPDELLPNKYLLTNSSGTGIIMSDIDTIINTPIIFGQFRLVAKGYQYVDDEMVANIETYADERGDWYEGPASDGWYYKAMRWKGGNDLTLLDSYEWGARHKVSLQGEPYYEN